MNVADFLLEFGEEGHVALVADAHEYTFLDLKRAAAGMAREILQAGARPGDTVGLLATNSLFWITAYLATIKLGCVAVPFNPASMPEELLTVVLPIAGVVALQTGLRRPRVTRGGAKGSRRVRKGSFPRRDRRDHHPG